MTYTPEEGAQIFKRDTMRRVRLPRARREELLDEYERSGISGVPFAAYVVIKYSTPANQRLAAVAALQAILVAQLQADRFLFLVQRQGQGSEQRLRPQTRAKCPNIIRSGKALRLGKYGAERYICML